MVKPCIGTNFMAKLIRGTSLVRLSSLPILVFIEIQDMFMIYGLGIDMTCTTLLPFG
jgi:hypothetical protein